MPKLRGKGTKIPKKTKQPSVFHRGDEVFAMGEVPMSWILQGSTTHFNVYYDPELGDTGRTVADGVLSKCENDYNQITGIFGNNTPPALPMNIRIYQFGGGAYHYGCNGVDLYCDIKKDSPDTDYTSFLVVAEEVEVFSAAQGVGWDCSASNGEGLSRVLATLLYPQELDGFATAASWLDTEDRPDFVDTNNPTDTNRVSNGCSVLFLNYLRYQLNFGWDKIVQAGAPTLAETYAKLTGSDDGFSQFSSLLQTRFPVGVPSGLVTDNPFPISDG